MNVHGKARPGDGLFLFALAAAVLWLYLAGIKAAPAYDDSLVGTVSFKSGTPLGVLKGFLNPAPPLPQGVSMPAYAYRPLTEASIVLNEALTHSWLGFPGLRLGNLLIHLAAAGLVFVLARSLALEPPAFARWAAAFFALHPLGVEAVTYVYQRSVSLEALCVFLTLLLYLKGRRGWAWLAGLLAMTAKEPAVTLPLLLLVIEWIVKRKPEEKPSTVLKRWLPFALLPGLVLVQVLRAAHQAEVLNGPPPPGTVTESGFHGMVSGYTPWQYLLIELPILVRYLAQSLLPFPLRFYDDRVYALPGQHVLIPWPATLLSGAVLLALAAWVLFGSRRLWMPRLALALFFAPLALESTVFPIQDLAFNHRCYPGLLGAGLLFAWGVTRLPRSWTLGGIPALVLMGWITLGENRVWADSAALLSRDVRQAFHRVVIWGNYAWNRLEGNRPERAERLFRHALDSPWQNSRTRVGLAAALSAQGRDREAARAYDAAIRAFPQDATILWLAVIQAVPSGDKERLEALARRAEALSALTPELALWVGCTRLEQGRPGEAQKVLERQLPYFPTHPQLLDLLGRSLQLQGKSFEAEEAYRRALDLAPDFEVTRRDLGGLYLNRGAWAEAEAQFREALRLKPDDAGAADGLRKAMTSEKMR